MSKKEKILQIRCAHDVKIAFKTLAVKLDLNYEDTLKQLLALEQEKPLQKRPKGVIERF